MICRRVAAVTQRRGRWALLTLLLGLLSLAAIATMQVQAAAGDAQIPGGFDHEPVIVTKETLPPRFKPARIADAGVPKGAGSAKNAAQLPVVPPPTPAAAGAAIPLSPMVPSDGRSAPRHSFAAPFVSRVIPGWNLGAGAVAEPTHLRLTPARQSRTGYAWNTAVVEMSDWEVLLQFEVRGRADFGGDGFALWFVERPEVLGNVYGSTDYWNGLGVFFDTFNNDGVGKSPLISAVFNDGTLKYDHGSDGATQALASCSFDFRNPSPEEPTFAKLNYHNQVLTLDIALHRDNAGVPQWANCFAIQHVELGVDKYFGVTAHTGEVADSHDILSFATTDLSPASVDLDEIRHKYTEEVHAQQHLHEGRGPTGLLSAEDFQHQVLTLLQQMQGEINMIESGQIEVQEWVLSQREAELLKEEAEIHREAEIEARGGNHGETAATIAIMQEIKAVKAMVGSAPAAAPASGAPPQAAQGLPSSAGGAAGAPVTLSGASVVAITSALKDLLAPMRSSLDASSSALAEVRAQMASQLALQRKLDEMLGGLSKMQGALASIQSNTNEANLVLTGSASKFAAAAASGTVMPGNSSGDLGWFLWVVLVFSAGCIFILTVHTFVQHHKAKQDRYKYM